MYFLIYVEILIALQNMFTDTVSIYLFIRETN